MWKASNCPRPPGAHDTQHGGGADVVLPAVQRVAHQLRQHLRQGGVQEHAHRSHALGAQRGAWAGGRVFDGLGEQPAQHTRGVQRQRQRAGKRPQTGRDQQQRRPHQFRDAAQGIEQQPRRRPAPGGVAVVQPAGRQRQRHAGRGGQHRAQQRHGQGFPGTHGHLGGRSRARGRAGRIRPRNAPCCAPPPATGTAPTADPATRSWPPPAPAARR